MNKQRRAKLAEIGNRIETCTFDLEAVRDEEQDAYDNMPEGLQSSLRGEAMEEAVDKIDLIIDTLHEVIGDLGGVT